MSNNIVLITGGTGGHVIPAENFGNYLISKNFNCTIFIDNRGLKYLNKFKGNIRVIESYTINKNFFINIIHIIKIFIGFLKSFIIISKLKPNRVISFGSYASLPPLMACLVLKLFFNIKIFIHEQNSIVGRVNKLFLKLAYKIFLNFNIKEKLRKEYHSKSFIVGTPENINLNYNNKTIPHVNKAFTIFVYGGSQGSEYLINFITHLIDLIEDDQIKQFNFIIQSPKNLISKIKEHFNTLEYNFIIQEYFNNMDSILKKTSLVISRAGAGTINDLIEYNIPSILIPLPFSKDNHQYQNALILKKLNLAIIINEKENEYYKAKEYIYEIFQNKKKLTKILEDFQNIKINNTNELMYKLMVNEK